jgi:hypothetical protein
MLPVLYQNNEFPTVFPHDRKGGGLVVLILEFSWETLYLCPFQIVFPHGPFMVKLRGDPSYVHSA